MSTTTTASVQDVEQAVKCVVSIHREIFHAYLESIMHAPIYKIRAEKSSSPEGPTIYKYSTDDDAKAKSGRQAFSAKVSPQMYTTILKWDECDFAVHTLIESVTKQLQNCVPGETGKTFVEWMSLNVTPKLRIRSKMNREEQPDHSALCLTVPCAAAPDRYLTLVADFTIEQFGFDRNHWFMAKDDYFSAVCANNAYKMKRFEEQDEKIEWGPDHSKGQDRIRKVCEELRWDEVKKMAPTERVRYLYKYYEYSYLLIEGKMSADQLHRLSLESYTDADPFIPIDD